MQIDAPPQQDSRGRYNQPTGQQTRGGYPPDNGQNPSNRGGYMDSRGPSYQQPDSLMTDAYGRVSVAQPYQDPRFAGRQPPMVDGAPPGMVRQGDYYVPVTSGYGQPGVMAPARPDTQQYPPGPYGQQVEPQRDPRSTRDPRDPRYGGVQPDFNDTSRYNYPSPATTVASVGSRDTISSPPGPRFALLCRTYALDILLTSAVPTATCSLNTTNMVAVSIPVTRPSVMGLMDIRQPLRNNSRSLLRPDMELRIQDTFRRPEETPEEIPTMDAGSRRLQDATLQLL